MAKQHEPNINLPEEVRCGEFWYLHVPYLDVMTKGIRRLNIPFRGPFCYYRGS